jgi:Raf kinase inhibitor-like YbhB/YbcL family protein
MVCHLLRIKKQFPMANLASIIFNATLVVSSSAFSGNGMIPARYTCEGEGVGASPALHIAGLPANTVTLAIVVHDPDAPKKGGFTHWVAWNIDPTTDIPENFKGGMEGSNGSGNTGYMGPCPPSGTHHYHFMIYALDTRLSLGKDTDKDRLESAMEGHILAQGELVGLYKKMK